MNVEILLAVLLLIPVIVLLIVLKCFIIVQDRKVKREVDAMMKRYELYKDIQ